MNLKAFLIATLLGSVLAVSSVEAGEDTREVLASHTLTALDGKDTTLLAFRGEVVVVNFWASWCAPCRKELPIMNEWHVAWAGRGARVVAISIDEEMRKAKRFADKMNLSMSLFHDGPAGLAQTLDLPSLPCTFLLDREGNVVSVVRTSSTSDLTALREQVETLLSSPHASAEITTDGGKR